MMTLSKNPDPHEKLTKKPGKNVLLREILDHVESFLNSPGSLRIAGQPLREPQMWALLGFKAWLETPGEIKMGHIVAPPGSGKTNTMILLAEACGGKVLILTKNISLAQQTKNAFLVHQTSLPVDQQKEVGACFGGFSDTDKDLTIGLFDSAHKWDTHMPWSDIRLIMVDEADVTGLSKKREQWLKSIAEQYQIPIIGLSATEEQGSGKSLQDVFPDEILHFPVPRGLLKMREMGLVPDLTFRDFPIDLTLVLKENEKKNSDFLDQSIQTLIQNPLWMNTILDHYQAHFTTEGRRHHPGLLIFRNNAQINEVLEACEKRGIRAASFTGEMGQNERRDILEKFDSGEIEFLVGSALLGRGVDFPSVRVTYNSTVTKSPQVFWQANGRGFRIDPKDPKKKSEVICVLPVRTLKEKSDESVEKIEMPLSHAAFFDPDHFDPNRAGESQGFIMETVTTIRSSREIIEMQAHYRKKPKNYRGLPSLLATAIAQLQSVTGKQIRQLVSKGGKNLKGKLEHLNALDTPDAEELLGPYSRVDELTLTEEWNLLHDYHLGKSSPDKSLHEKSLQAKSRLFESHKRLIQVIAKRMAPDDPCLEEDIEISLISKFYEFLEKHQPQSKMRFCRYFLKYGIHHLERDLSQDQVRSLHLPISILIAFRRIDKVRDQLLETLQRPPSLRELEAAAREEDRMYAPSYINFLSRTLRDTMDEDPNKIHKQESSVTSGDPEQTQKRLDEALTRLKLQRRLAVIYTFGLKGKEPLTHQQLAEILRTTQQNISLRLKKGLEDLRSTSYLTKLEEVGESQEAFFNTQVRECVESVKIPILKQSPTTDVESYVKEYYENNVPGWESYREVFRKEVLIYAVSHYKQALQNIRHQEYIDFSSVLKCVLQSYFKAHRRKVFRSTLVPYVEKMAQEVIIDWDLYDEAFRQGVVDEVLKAR